LTKKTKSVPGENTKTVQRASLD